MNISWDTDKYASDFAFVHQYGVGVTELLDIKPGMTVVDLGCGTGVLTQRLSERGIRAIGIDASENFIRKARETYPDIRFILADATDFRLDEKVDAVFSNAVFHWIDRERQPDMLRCVYSALRPGGQLVFEFGGCGNCALIHSGLEASFRQRGLDYRFPNYFPTIGEYASLLEKCGFKVTYMTLFDRPTRLNGSDGLSDWIKMFVQKPFEGLDERTREAVINQTAEALRDRLCDNGVWYSDYVRIRGKAVK